ncbi:hypothetical protein [Streptomyces sp. NBC_00370]|uniref:hypothetical protein n=1 Tax=Streptomyces sp. NBC_00370 TaxID=2975728 RepID=UPI002E275A12
MTTAQSTDGHSSDGWTAAVRERLGLGRLLPLGAAADGAWLAEQAATAELRLAAAAVPGVVPGRLRVSLHDPAGAGTPAVPAPPSALPPGPLLIEGEFGALVGEPLPAVATRLRAALLACATERLGLLVDEVDLRVTGLLDGPDDSTAPAGPVGVPAVDPQSAAAFAVTEVPGVAHLTGTLGEAVEVAADHVRVELATAAGHRPPDVARAVRAAVTAAVPGALPVAVVITAVERPGRE